MRRGTDAGRVTRESSKSSTPLISNLPDTVSAVCTAVTLAARFEITRQCAFRDCAARVFVFSHAHRRMYSREQALGVAKMSRHYSTPAVQRGARARVPYLVKHMLRAYAFCPACKSAPEGEKLPYKERPVFPLHAHTYIRARARTHTHTNTNAPLNYFQ